MLLDDYKCRSFREVDVMAIMDIEFIDVGGFEQVADKVQRKRCVHCCFWTTTSVGRSERSVS